jgi:glycosyltransferase involved in cell wall biosynthesis
MRQQLSVGVVCAYYLPRNNAPTIRLRYFVEALAKFHRITVLTADAGGDIDGISIRRWPRFAQQNRNSAADRMFKDVAFGLRAALAVMRGRFDVLVVSSPVFLASYIVTQVARWRDTPVLLDVRDPYPEVFAAAGKLSPESALYRFLDRLATSMYRRAAAIVTVTDGLREMICARLQGNSQVHVVPNGYPAALQELRRPKRSPFSVVFHGTLGAFQDLKSLVALADRLSPQGIQVIVIGKGSSERVLLDGKPDNLKYLGELPFNETMEHVALAYVGVSLRTPDSVSRDSFPVKIFEYVGLGLPVIVTPRSQGGDYVAKHGLGFQFDSGDVDSIAATIVSLRDQPDRYDALVARILEHRGHLTRESQAIRFRELLEGLAAAAPEIL